MRGAECVMGLTLRELAAVVAEYQAMHDSRFRCGDCLSNHVNAPNRAQRIERDRVFKGCYGPEPLIERALQADRRRTREQALAAAGYRFGGVRFMGCPGNLRTDWGGLMVRTWSSWRLGLQPVPGGVAALPSKTYEAFSVLDSMEAQRIESEDKRRKADEALERAKGEQDGGKRKRRSN